MTKKMTVDEFENTVLRLEEIVIRIRTSVYEEIDAYDYQRRASGSTSVTEWLNTRIYPFLGNHEMCIIDGNWQHPHGRTKLSTLRDSYDK